MLRLVLPPPPSTDDDEPYVYTTVSEIEGWCLVELWLPPEPIDKGSQDGSHASGPDNQYETALLLSQFANPRELRRLLMRLSENV
jgi:hypothetical protein